jgi:hypothetical protein
MMKKAQTQAAVETKNASLLQRQCACGQHTSGEQCGSCQKSGLTNAPLAVSPGGAAASDGNLPQHVRKEMGTRFGMDFSGVRVYTDAAAGKEAVDLGARAFTKNGDIYFAPGHYQPDSRSGQALIAHELTHVVQQRRGHVVNGGLGALGDVAAAQSSLEREAVAAERGFLSSGKRIEVQEAASPRTTHRSVGETFDAIKEAASGGLQAVAGWVVGQVAAADALVGRLDALRVELTDKVKSVVLSPEAVALAARIYSALAPYIPAWLPAPEFQFKPALQTAAPLIVIGGVALGVAEVLLILAFFIVMLWLVARSNPNIRKAQDKAVEDLMNKIKESTKPKQKPEPEPEPEKPPPTTGPTPIPSPKEDKPKRPYPICWPTQLGPPNTSLFVRTNAERDEEEAAQARVALQWRQFRDPDFNADAYHVHHIQPLFLGGADDLKANGKVIPKSLHLKGHAVLRRQPQMASPPDNLPSLPTDLYAHPAGTPYRLAGFKESADETC